MPKKVIILTIPGIGTQNPGYAKKLEDALVKKLRRTPAENNIRIIESRPFSVTEVDDNQEALYRRLSAVNRLGGILSFRKFVLDAFGDGVAFERNATDPNGTYHKIHRYIKERVEQVYELGESFEDYRLIIVAHSMGCHLVSTYIWDVDKGRGIFEYEEVAERNQLKNLNYLMTIGCNIPLFVSGLRENQITPFNKRNEKFTWDNYFDPDDILGWPLQQLSQKYNDLVTDHEVNTGLYIGSHMRYWNDSEVIVPLAKKVNELFDEMG